MGWKMDALFHAMGFKNTPGNWNLYKQMGYGGEQVGFEKFITAAGYAGIGVPHATVIYAMEQVPEAYRHYIGCTVGLHGKRKRTPGKLKEEEFRPEHTAIMATVPRGVPVKTSHL